MAEVTFSIKMDDKLKKEFEELCNKSGMNITTAFNLFARIVVREKNIPFEILSEEEYERKEAIENFEQMRKSYFDNGGKEFTLEEINEEIRKARLEKRNKKIIHI